MDLEKMKALATEAKALAERATPGPWRDEYSFNARARTAVPELADAVLALAAEVERTRDNVAKMMAELAAAAKCDESLWRAEVERLGGHVGPSAFDEDPACPDA